MNRCVFTISVAALLTFCCLHFSQAQRKNAAAYGYGAVVAPTQAMSPQKIEALARYSQRMSDAEFQTLVETSKLSPELVYFLPGWLPGVLSLKNGSARRFKNLRYNLVLQRVEVLDSVSNRVDNFYSTEDLKGFTLSKSSANYYTFENLPHKASGKGPEALFETINTGAIRLLLLHDLDIRPAVSNDALHVEMKPEEYYRITRLFSIIEGQKSASELALNRRSVLKIFGQRAKEVDYYSKANNINFTQLSDVLKLVERFNVSTTSN